MIRAVLIACMLGTRVLADDASDLARAAKSPYLIAAWLLAHPDADLAPLNAALRLKEPIQLRQPTPELLVIPEPRQVIVILKGDFTREDYLRFMPVANGADWRLAGHYVRPAERHVEPRHGIRMVGSK